jgi:hypothetical protein
VEADERAFDSGINVIMNKVEMISNDFPAHKPLIHTNLTMRVSSSGYEQQTAARHLVCAGNMNIKKEKTQCSFAMLSRDVFWLSPSLVPKRQMMNSSKPGFFLAYILFRNIRPLSCLCVDALARSARPSCVLERES